MRRPKILVCDDDPIIVQIIISKLLSEGFDVASVSNGRDVMSRLKKEVPALLILDAMMPGLDGAAILATIRGSKRLHALPVMMLSARRDPEFVAKVVKLGANDYLAKPFALIDLADRVKRLTRPPETDTFLLN